MKRLFNFLMVSLFATGLFLVGCGEDETPVVDPTASFEFVASTDNPAMVTFTSTLTDVVSVSWDFGDGETSTDENPTHTYAAAGDYTVVLTATGEEGSTAAVAQNTVSVVFTSNETAIFLRGAVNSDAWDNPQEAVLIANNTWQVACGQSLTSGTTYEWKFANTNDWSGADWGGGEGASGTVQDASGGGANCSFTPDADGVYVFTLNDETLAFTISAQ